MYVWVSITGSVIVWNIEPQLSFTSKHNVYSETGDVDGDGELEFPTSSQFSTSCGCSTTTVSTTDIGTETTTTTEIGTETTTTTDISTETTTTSCAEGDPFTISSSVFPSLEGCVLYSGFVAADGNLVYNSSSAAIISVSSSTTTTDGSAVSIS